MDEPGRSAVSARQAAVMDLIRTADELRRHFGDFYEPYGITAQQYNVLRILRGAGPKGLPTMEIADRMVEKTPGITRLLDRLEEKGLVQRERRAEDRRQVVAAIRSAGLALLRELDEPVKRVTEAALDLMSPGEVEGFGHQLERIRQAVGSGQSRHEQVAREPGARSW